MSKKNRIKLKLSWLEKKIVGSESARYVIHGNTKNGDGADYEIEISLPDFIVRGICYDAKEMAAKKINLAESFKHSIYKPL